jgi:hypothetical protein
MKKLIFFLAILPFLSSCSTSKEVQSSNAETRQDRKIAEQAIVKKAVESKRYIIKLDRMYFRRGGSAYLYPRANYIIIDGNKAVISTAYIGRQFDIKPIAGINTFGRSENYELTSNPEKGIYKVTTEVSNGSNSFDLYLTIGKNGYCYVSLNNGRLDFVSYKGYLVPIKSKVKMPLQNREVI